MTSLQILDITQDSRSSCYSILTKMTIADYLTLIKPSFDNQGNLKGQRDTIPTATARKIRKRLAEDLKQGAIIPPIVIGLIAGEQDYGKFINYENNENNNFVIPQEAKGLLAELIKTPAELSVIDGMQRTTVLQDLHQDKPDLKIRVEFWIAKQVQSLTYRMLVLNTGQTPWTLRRQVEVVFKPLIKEIKQKLASRSSVVINELDELDKSRGTDGIFYAHKVVEMYRAFALRRYDIEFKDELAEEFSKITMIESLSKNEFLDNFITVFSILTNLDMELSKKDTHETTYEKAKFLTGKDLFSSHTACIGFIVAAARKIYGYPTQERNNIEQDKAIKFIQQQCEELQKNIQEADFDLGFDILNVNVKNLGNARVGDKERDFFSNGFGILFKEDFKVEKSLAPFWVK